MHSRLGRFVCSLGLGALAISAFSAPGAAASAPVSCAGATTTTTPASGAPTTKTINAGEPPPTGAPDGACWMDVEPYPFGAEGEPVKVNSPNCPFQAGSTEEVGCYLTVTSLAFRAWNRGLAAASEQTQTPENGSSHPNPYGVWIF